jgi:hypothetical protein
MLDPMDAGNPISYEVLEPGTPVYSSDGQLIGAVAHVLAVPEEDVFDGIVIDERSGAAHLSGRGDHRFADANIVGSLHERAVSLKLDASACAELPRPAENPAVMRADPSDTGSGELSTKLRHAWDLISGKY